MAKKIATRFSKRLGTSTQPQKNIHSREEEKKKEEKKKQPNKKPHKNAPIKIARRFTKSSVANPRNQNKKKSQ